MLPATTTAKGDFMAASNPCKIPTPTGPVVAPFVSQAKAAMMRKTSKKVLIGMRDTVTEASQAPSSSGDEGGTLGGVASGMNMGPVQPTQGSSTVSAEGKKVVFATASAKHNGGNAVGLQISESQTNVLVAL